jgi:hypothetical protein
MKVPKMVQIEGTQMLHYVASFASRDEQKEEKRKLKIATIPCSCLSCHGKNKKECEFVELRQEKDIWVKEKKKKKRNDQTPRKPQQIPQNLTAEEEEVKLKGMLFVKSITVK